MRNAGWLASNVKEGKDSLICNRGMEKTRMCRDGLTDLEDVFHFVKC